jgi:hypothetical protein
VRVRGRDACEAVQKHSTRGIMTSPHLPRAPPHVEPRATIGRGHGLNHGLPAVEHPVAVAVIQLRLGLQERKRMSDIGSVNTVVTLVLTVGAQRRRSHDRINVETLR